MVSANDFGYIADLTLFLKYRSGDDLMLSDVPAVIPLRWTWFMQQWQFIRSDLLNEVASYNEPDYFKSQIYAMDTFIAQQSAISSNLGTNPFSNSNIFFQFYGIFDNIAINSIDLTNQETTIVTNAINRVSLFNKGNFLAIKNDVIAARDAIADQIGLGDSTYNAAVGRNSLPQQTIAQIEDLDRIQYLQNCVFSVNFILANISSLSTSYVDPFALARVNANNPDFNVDSYASGNLVRFNYGEDLTLLAYRYLGDPDKWIDIAIANGLKAPYIDEVGEQLPLVTNGDGNEINIAQLDVNGNPNINNIYINQIVILQSSTQLPDQRTIINIKQIPVTGEIIVGLSGLPNMNMYTTTANAYMRVFAPNTINSQFFILIPSTQPLPSTVQAEVPYFLLSSDPSERNCGVDFALSAVGDLLINSTGDFQLSYGLANAIQAIKLKMVTEAGTLLRHPEFGLVNVVGTSTNNVEAIQNAITKSINDQIALDPRFQRVESLDVQYLVNYTTSQSGVGFMVTMLVSLAGAATTVIPITFTVTA